MNNKIKKIGCSVGISLHLFLLNTIFMVGEGILFGIRYFDEVIRTFTGIEIIISIASMILIFKDKQIGFILLAISILSTYIIQFGHRMLWWPCEYCRL
ncbi:hypothetical protein C5F50_06585 [Nitrosopumilus ureiphilus]|uniref:Uncharacterized protein n=2 Tax=Nitrosopumilus ureiphilus TaxID=1470067 RepID=A0A7D5R7H1_9ARCH|nr:hypothetical protein C5F50_06585 [Nitrosopumilus ureiphilus]